MKIKEDWLINNKNIFGLSDKDSISISTIQYEILNQIDNKEINLISEYLDYDIKITSEIKLTDSLTIESIFKEYLEFEFNPLNAKLISASLILNYLQLVLTKVYFKENCKNILTSTEYKKQYQTLCNDYLYNNVDTDEKDFINSELELCAKLISELEKPIYSVLGLGGVVLDTACNFKKDLTNSIDKRVKFLKIKEEQASQYVPKEKHVITKQSITYHRRTSDYLYTEKELSRLKLQMDNNQVEKHIRYRTQDDNGDYKFTDDREINSKINYAVKRDYKIFNEKNKNYKEVEFDNIGNIEVFKIDGVEYIIESNEKEDHEISISVYNYGYAEKWLIFLDGLKGNYRIGTLQGLKEDIIEDALKKNIYDINHFADNIENLFNHCLEFHNNERFENAHHITERYYLINFINMPGGIFWWKQEKWSDVNNCIGDLMKKLEDLFITVNPITFMQTRDFIILWIEKTVDITINNDTKMFQWAYSPFMDKIFNLAEKIKERFSDDRIRLKNELYKSTPQLTQINLDNKNKFTSNKESYPKNNNKIIKKKIGAKYYALYHWIQIEMGIEKNFELNENDQLPKSKIEDFAKERYEGVSPQMFYRSFKDVIDITNKTMIANSFGKDYKKKIIAISKDDAKIINHLKSYPN